MKDKGKLLVLAVEDGICASSLMIRKLLPHKGAASFHWAKASALPKL